MQSLSWTAGTLRSMEVGGGREESDAPWRSPPSGQRHLGGPPQWPTESADRGTAPSPTAGTPLPKASCLTQGSAPPRGSPHPTTGPCASIPATSKRVPAPEIAVGSGEPLFPLHGHSASPSAPAWSPRPFRGLPDHVAMVQL